MKPESNILAVYPNQRGFGFVLITANGELLDFGLKYCQPLSNDRILNTFKTLITRYNPDIVVTRCFNLKSDTMSDRIRSLLKQIDTIVSRSGIDLICHRRGDIQELFGSKYQYAQSFISIYPELIPYAFPVRKRWQPEHHNVGIFDALALALVTVARA